MAPRFARYLAAAFSARPIGMFIPPNWVGLAAFGLLGAWNPGFWLIGAGVELLYLFGLVSSKRFRKLIDAKQLRGEHTEWRRRLESEVAALSHPAQIRYRALETRCREMVDGRLGETPDSLNGAFGRLLWVYLQLLATREATVRLLADSESEPESGPARRGRGADSLEARAADLQRRLSDGSMDGDLRRSLEGQLDLIGRRMESRKEARDKIDFIDAELVRIEEQVQLVKEQAVLAQDPESASRRIDAISSTLGSTTNWIRDQRRISGELSDVLEDPPPVILPTDRADEAR